MAFWSALARRCLNRQTGRLWPLLPLWGGPRYKAYNRKDVDVVNFTADQFIGQEQNVDVATGVNVAFADHIKSVVKPTQNANNNINFS